MKTSIAKEFKWEMSHRLPYHKGPCRNIHGHTYKMRIEISGEPDAHGMLMDYFTIKKIVDPLLDKLDHSFICDDKDTELIEFLVKMQFKHLVIPYYSTAENIAKFIIFDLIPHFELLENLDWIKLRLYETDDVFAELYYQFKRP